MRSLHSVIRFASFCCVLASSSAAAASSEVPRWARFEGSFESDRDYADPLRDAQVRVRFTSPEGQTRSVRAFWDGGRDWRVRVSPDRTGAWTWRSECSDATNRGLHDRRGSFRCTPYQGDNALYRHGELRLSENRRHLEHADGRPFFWLADTVWCGPLLATREDWRAFLHDRVAKAFTGIQFVLTQWRMTPADAAGNPTYTGKERIQINPAFFQRMDGYLDDINEAGLLAIPVLLWAIRGEANPGWDLPEDQKTLLAQYMAARYGAHQVIWFLGGDGDYSGDRAEEWKRIGRAVFHPDQQRLATMHVRGKSWVGREFRGEPWFDLITYQSGHGDDERTMRWLNQGPPSTEWRAEPMLPVVNAEPNYEAHNGYTSRKVHNDHSVRRSAYWSLLVSPPAGVTYGGQGIWGWHTKVQAPADHLSTGLGSPWWLAKDLPGALSMKHLHELFRGLEWWRLEPAPELLAHQPGKEDASRFIAVAAAPERDLTVAYLPEGGEIRLRGDSVRRPARARWYHPRTGGWIDVGPVAETELRFEAADRNDWVLLLESSRMRFPGRTWEEASPESEGLDSRKLEAAVSYLEANSGSSGVRELAIVRNGRMVWKGDNIDHRHGVWSCTKSFTSTVLGLLIDDGACALDTLGCELDPDLAPAYPEVRLRHFATMTSGYRALGDEPRGSYTHGPSPTPFLPNPMPLFTPPGSNYAYWDSAMNEFAYLLTLAARESIKDLFRRRIAAPIGMDPDGWDWGNYALKDGLVVNGGSGNGNKHVFITARQMARFGHLVLNRGNWNGTQLLSEDWVNAATAVQVPASVPLAHRQSGIAGPGCYGFNWWVNGLTPEGQRLWPGAPEATFAASGYNNNKLFVVPEWGMVVVRLGLDQDEGKIGDAVWGEFLRRTGDSIR